jgi:hypothetical protein
MALAIAPSPRQLTQIDLASAADLAIAIVIVGLQGSKRLMARLSLGFPASAAA